MHEGIDRRVKSLAVCPSGGDCCSAELESRRAGEHTRNGECGEK